MTEKDKNGTKSSKKEGGGQKDRRIEGQRATLRGAGHLQERGEKGSGYDLYLPVSLPTTAQTFWEPMMKALKIQ